MSQTIQALLRHLRETADTAGTPTDAELLDRFARQGDAAAFAALVARHGPMVLGVCRRVLADAHDAEDAFQATFLVLARKAGTLCRGDPVGAWLHGVARRVAAHARADRTRRRDCERRALKVATGNLTPAALWEDLRPVLDEEVGKLPTRYRVPVVLCYLGGRTYDEAAREIGCPKGTVATRLAKARELLRARLTERGIDPPAAVLAAALADHARAVVPTSLLHTTVAGAAAGAAPPAVATLAEGVMRVMLRTRLKVVGTLVIVVGLLAGGAALAPLAAGPGAGGQAPPPKKGEQEQPRADQPPADPGWIRVRSEKKTVVFRPDGTGRDEYPRGPEPDGTPSPDRRRLLRVRTGFDTSVVELTDSGGKNARQISPKGLYAGSPVWSPDGRRVAFVAVVNGQHQVHVVDGDGRNTRQVTDGPFGAWGPQFAPDGRLAYLLYRDPLGKRQRADLVIADGTKTFVAVKETVFAGYAWSPDGKSIAYGRPNALVFHEVGSGAERAVALTDIDRRLGGHAVVRLSWSPDSRAVAFGLVFWGGRQAGGPKMLGDEEVFVVPPAGKPRWFGAGGPVQGVEWARHRVDCG